MCLLRVLQKGSHKAFHQADTRAMWPRRSEVKGCLPLSLVISFGISIIFLRCSVRRGRDGYFYTQWFLKVMWFQNLLFLQYYSVLPTLQAKRCFVRSFSLPHLCWIQAITFKTDFWASGTPTKLPILHEFFFKNEAKKIKYKNKYYFRTNFASSHLCTCGNWNHSWKILGPQTACMWTMDPSGDDTDSQPGTG